MNTLKRNFTFVLSYLACCALYLWFDPIVRPPACYLADGLMALGGVAGLAWANHKAFRGKWPRWLGVIARVATVAVLFAVLTAMVVLYSWRIQPKIGEILTPSSHIARHPQSFFPPLAFSSNAEHNAFEVDWYTRQLSALGEGSFYSLASDTNAHAFRFTCLRSFHNPFCVVMTFDGNGRAVVTGKLSSGTGGYAPGRLCRLIRATIRPCQSQDFLDLLAKESFWTLASTFETFGCCDGSRWIMEGVDHGTYHLVDRWTPEESTPVGRMGREMIGLSGMRIWFLY